ncbi:hypothetical protein [Nitrosospira multiformis]|uniref:Uncharacterized protein n=1 Tax=Nitrosospira multiformis TaxID=1231 RepID=A0A1I7GJU1_9PROT|nr:hypothetical protein [Nitrosospira multiformis]SFU48710.1 hypothetical protein SAMN05216417_10515 [Nitrosospira multiformis]
MKLAMVLLTGGLFALSSAVQAQHNGIGQEYNGLRDLQRTGHARYEQMMLEQQQLRVLQEQNEHRRRDRLRSQRLRAASSWGGHRFRLRAWAAATLAKGS